MFVENWCYAILGKRQFKIVMNKLVTSEGNRTTTNISIISYFIQSRLKSL